MDFVFATASATLASHSELVATLGIGLLFAFTLIVAKKGFFGLGFWGKQRSIIAEHHLNYGTRSQRIFIYRLTDNSGYEGYGLEFSRLKTKAQLGHARMKSSAMAIEFTKDEADQLVDLVKPHLH